MTPDDQTPTPASEGISLGQSDSFTVDSKSHEQMEREAGSNIARTGGQLPDHASPAAKQGYEETKAELAKVPATSLDPRSNPIAFGTPGPGGVHREIVTHKVNGLNDEIKVEALDEPGAGGANHHYRISRVVTPATTSEQPSGFIEPVDIKFQNGPIKVAGVNGISNEALLAILRDRLEGFQNGEFANSDNENALDGIKNAMRHLHKRTKDRIARGVEGTSAQ